MQQILQKVNHEQIDYILKFWSKAFKMECVSNNNKYFVFI